jgi:1-acyl-sn-glycerol-3-phosphate acyltransferase
LASPDESLAADAFGHPSRIAPLRVAWRLVALSAVSAALYVFLLVTAAVLDLWGWVRGRAHPSGLWRATVFRVWARGVSRVMGMRIEVVGRPPPPPFLLVANHLSYTDIVLLATQVTGCFVSKADVAHWPLVGSMCRLVDTLFIDRERKRELPGMVEQIEEVCVSGRGVVLFPEGTSSKGDGVMPFRASLLEPAARSGRPVFHASLTYATAPDQPPAHLAVCWWGGMMFTPHVRRLLALREFRARVTFGEEPIRESDRKVLAARLREAVARDFEPVVNAEET